MVGPWDLDPFSNQRSHMEAKASCCLELNEDGFGDGTPGTFTSRLYGLARATPGHRVWLQPPYKIVRKAWQHYAHTRWCALLRFDPSTKWFAEIYAAATLIAIPRGRRINFDPPPGVKASSNSYPHALYYADARDATAAVTASCIVITKPVSHTLQENHQ